MVNQKVKVKDKHKNIKKFSKALVIIIIITAILTAAFFSGFLSKPRKEVILENPLKDIVFTNTNQAGQVNQQAVIDQGILNFNQDYINYLLVALGVGKLHKSYVGYGNPTIELNIGREIWSAEIDNGNLLTKKGPNENKDLIISLSKQEAVKALLSSNIEEFIKNSASSGNTQIQMMANMVELGSKGYLAMYKDLTGEEVEE